MHPRTVRAPKFSSQRFRPRASTTSSSSRLISAIWVLENFIPGVPSLRAAQRQPVLRQSRISIHCSLGAGAGELSAGVTPASLAVSAYTNFARLLAQRPVGDQLQTAQLNPAAREMPHSHRRVLVVCHPAVRRHLRFLRVSYANVRGGLLKARNVDGAIWGIVLFVESPRYRCKFNAIRARRGPALSAATAIPRARSS